MDTFTFIHVCMYILKYIRVTRVIPMESFVSYNIYIIIINHELSHLHQSYHHHHHRYNQQHSIIDVEFRSFSSHTHIYILLR